MSDRPNDFPRGMKKPLLLAWIVALTLGVANAPAYEVWMGTHLAPSAMASDLASWSSLAPRLDGVNINRAPHDTDPATNADWRTIIAQFTKAASTGTTMSEIPRSEVSKVPAEVNELAFPAIDESLTKTFSFENAFGYELDVLMFYDNATTYQGVEYLYSWTTIEVQHVRDWLDANGHADVKLMYNVRNNSHANRNWATNPLVEYVMIEASTTSFLNNTNGQITFIQWFWTNPATANKRLVLQIPRTQDSNTQYEGTRRVVQMLGTILGYGENGIRSNRLVFLPVTYNDLFPYIPETDSPTLYKDTLTGICLSLLEQRNLFEGRLATLPTVADADSLVRRPPPTVSRIADQIVSFNTATGPLAFTVADDLTPLSDLTLASASSNTTLVPLQNIVFGGSGANRTVTVTPAVGRFGTATITVSVSDGNAATTADFRITVLAAGMAVGTLHSTAADCGITEVPAIESLTAGSSHCGDSGSGIGVNRCIVYVFQLPNWGPVQDPFDEAVLTFHYPDKDGTPENVDLYGLGRRAAGTVLTSDYYGQTAVPDPSDATRLQASILTGATRLGLISTAQAGNTVLINYLNTQYAGGSGAGQFVFLRLNTAGAKAGIARFLLTLSEGGVAGPLNTRPRIAYTAQTNAPPSISAIPDQTVNESTPTGAIPFTVADHTTPANALVVTAATNNPSLVPATSIVLSGTGANRTVTVQPRLEQSGTATITLTVSDGAATTTRAFMLTVNRPSDVVLALPGGGPINDANTWDRVLPVVGDGRLWRTGANVISMATAVETFNGGTFVVQAGGKFEPGVNGAVLTLNDVILNGGTISMRNNAALIMDLSGDVLTLNSGTIQAGGTSNSRDVRFRNGSLAGNGTIQIIGTDTTGSDVDIQFTVATKGFTGIFDVKDHGILNLPTILPNNASFGLVLSGTGKYAHDANVALTSLVIAGTTIPPGIHSRSSFTPAQQAFFVGTDNALTITVNRPPVISTLATLTISANTTSAPIAFTIGDTETAPAALTVTRTSNNQTLVPNGNIGIGGQGANRTITLTPVANKLGTATITLNVNDGIATTSTTFTVHVIGSAAETWRFNHFATTANLGTAEDLADPNQDGESNMLEFATGQNPFSNSNATTLLVRNASMLEYTYSRNIAALTDGLQFAVEWSNTMAAGSWSSTGVSEQILADNGTLQTVKATLPAGASAKRFVRLKVTQP